MPIEYKKAILAAINLNEAKDFEYIISECKSLCEANHINIIETIIQTSRTLDPNFAFRSGKLEELKLKSQDVDLVVFFNNLNYKLLGRIQDYLECPVLDRTNLILDIFANRAKTKEAMIQTEVARLRYRLPLHLRSDTEDKMRGGVKNKGKGEKRGALYKRNIESNIKQLELELIKIEKERQEKANKRKKSILKKVALVGYTNAGKSSLMNLMLNASRKDEKQVFEKDMLFATLDTSIRRVKYMNYEFLLYDTVGFVSDLPHELIDSFKSTLSATKEADLLLNIMDGSNPNNFQQKTITYKTLNEIGSGKKPIIDVYNKIDLCEEKHEDLFEISTKTNYGIDSLMNKIISILYPKESTYKCLIPYAKLAVIEEYKMVTDITILENNEEGTLIDIKGSDEFLENFKMYVIKK